MDTKKLRQKILDLAIRGKLVPQDPNDEPASVLLERIREEKKQMVKEGKLKAKDIKNDTIIFKGEDNLHYEKFQDGTVKCIEDEIPFDVPEGWCWARLNTIIDVRDGTHDTPKYVDKGVPLFTSKNLSPSGLDYSNVKYISHEDARSINERSGVDKGDILYAMIGTIGNPTIVDSDIEMSIKNVALFKFSYSHNLSHKYMLYFFSYAQDYMKRDAAGGLQPFVSLNYLRNYLVPIPPVAEQERVCTKCDLLTRNIVLIDNDRSLLSDSTEKAKAKILDLAIKGKLVPQDPNDEPSSILLERIRKEKEELIKQGKLKRDKKESLIYKGDDNSYYHDLPVGWEIVSLKDITTPLTLNDGDWILSENMDENGDVNLIQLGSIGNMNYVDKGFKHITEATFKELSCTQIKSGYLLINRIISDRMNCCILPTVENKSITTVDTCWIAPNNSSYNIKFLMYALSSPMFQEEVKMNTAGTTRKRISKGNLVRLAIPFPPINEQTRIVEAIENIFKLVDTIMMSIE